MKDDTDYFCQSDVDISDIYNQFERKRRLI